MTEFEECKRIAEQYNALDDTEKMWRGNKNRIRFSPSPAEVGRVFHESGCYFVWGCRDYGSYKTNFYVGVDGPSGTNLLAE